MEKGYEMRVLLILFIIVYFQFLISDPIEIAESYRDMIWFVNSDNVMG